MNAVFGSREYQTKEFLVACVTGLYVSSTDGRKLARARGEYDMEVYGLGYNSYANKHLKHPVYGYVLDQIYGRLYFLLYEADHVNKKGLNWHLIGKICMNSLDYYGSNMDFVKSVLGGDNEIWLVEDAFKWKKDMYNQEYILTKFFPILKEKEDLKAMKIHELIYLWLEGTLKKMYEFEMSYESEKFGVELEFTGLTRFQAAKTIAEMFEALHNKKVWVHKHLTEKPQYYVNDDQGRVWNLKYDGSIRAVRKGRETENTNYKCELVSPICTYKDIPLIMKIVQALKDAGMVVNDSCGIHVHVDTKAMSAANLKCLSLMLAAKEELLFKALKVEKSRRLRYCRKMKHSFVDDLRSERDLDMNTLKRLWYQEGVNGCLHYHSSRYSGLNLHSLFENKGIEFRYFNGSDDSERIRAYILFCVLLVNTAKKQERTALHRMNPCTDKKKCFRAFLYHIGMTGKKFKRSREYLLEGLYEEYQAA